MLQSSGSHQQAAALHVAGILSMPDCRSLDKRKVKLHTDCAADFPGTQSTR